MSKQEILYLAYGEGPWEDGLSYALYLAAQMGKSLRICLMNHKSAGAKLEDMFAAVAFAEAGEHATARQLFSGSESPGEAVLEQKILERCSSEGVPATVHLGLVDNAPSLAGCLRHKSIDIILLSPAVSENRGLRKHLMRLSPRPLITMARSDSRPHS